MRHLIKEWGRIAEDIRDKRIYLFLDFDGTLTFIRRHPKKVKLSNTTARALEKLLCLEDISIAVISGRALGDITKRVGITGIVYSGNHGLEAKGTGVRYILPGALRTKKTVRQIREKLKEKYRSFKGIYIEDKGLTLSVHFRMVDRRKVKKAEQIFKDIVIPYEDRGKIITTKGKKVWEIRPPVRWNKGKIALYLLEEKKRREKNRIVPFYVGDDRTDEDAFRLLSRIGYTVKVGKRHKQLTFADYYLNNTKEVRKFLKMLFILKGG